MTPTKKPIPAPAPAKPTPAADPWPKMNVRLLRKIQRQILARPEKYNQGAWCNSAFCIAGHAVVLGGTKADKAEFAEISKRVHKGGVHQSNLSVPVGKVARRLLRLTLVQSYLLFSEFFPSTLADEVRPYFP